jgi:excisionase family DNA binding protein
MTTQNNQNERLLKFLQASPETQAEIDRILDRKFQAKVDASTGPLLCGMTPGAKFLGVSRATLWRMIKAGRLGKVEVLPGSFRLRRADLEAIAAGKAVPHA